MSKNESEWCKVRSFEGGLCHTSHKADVDRVLARLEPFRTAEERKLLCAEEAEARSRAKSEQRRLHPELYRITAAKAREIDAKAAAAREAAAKAKAAREAEVEKVLTQVRPLLLEILAAYSKTVSDRINGLKASEVVDMGSPKSLDFIEAGPDGLLTSLAQMVQNDGRFVDLDASLKAAVRNGDDKYAVTGMVVADDKVAEKVGEDIASGGVIDELACQKECFCGNFSIDMEKLEAQIGFTPFKRWRMRQRENLAMLWAWIRGRR